MKTVADQRVKHEGFFWVVDMQDGHHYPCRVVSGLKDFAELCERLIGADSVFVETTIPLDLEAPKGAEPIIFRALEHAMSLPK